MKKPSRKLHEPSEVKLDNAIVPRSFWERKEGTTGMLFLGFVGLAGAIWLITSFATFLNWFQRLLHDGVMAGIYGSILFGMIAAISNNKFRKLIKYMFMSGMRKLTSLWTNTDPIGIMMSYVEEVGEKIQTIIEKMTQLKGEISSLKGEIARNNREKADAIAEAKASRDSRTLSESEKKRIFVLNSNKVERLDGANKDLEPLANNMEILYRILDKMRESAEFVRDDLSSRANIEARKRRSMQKGYSAFQAARSILAGNDVGAELYDDALEAAQYQYEQKMGEIDSIIDMSNGILSSADLRGETAALKLQEMLNNLESKQDAVLLPPGQIQMIRNQAADPSEVLDFESPVDIPTNRKTLSNEDPDKYQKLFKAK